MEQNARQRVRFEPLPKHAIERLGRKPVGGTA